ESWLWHVRSLRPSFYLVSAGKTRFERKIPQKRRCRPSRAHPLLVLLALLHGNTMIAYPPHCGKGFSHERVPVYHRSDQRSGGNRTLPSPRRTDKAKQRLAAGTLGWAIAASPWQIHRRRRPASFHRG